jgi:hypothetical protein
MRREEPSSRYRRPSRRLGYRLAGSLPQLSRRPVRGTTDRTDRRGYRIPRNWAENHFVTTVLQHKRLGIPSMPDLRRDGDLAST